jgi:hypothetical protein
MEQERSLELFEKMLKWGWVDGNGRDLPWDFWQRYWGSRTRGGRGQQN